MVERRKEEEFAEEAIVSFVLEKENLHITSPQDGLFRSSGYLVPGGTVKGFVFGRQYGMPLLTIDTWVMKDLNNEKWIKECGIIMKVFSNDFLKSTVPLDYHNWKTVMDATRVYLDCHDINESTSKSWNI